MKGILKQILRIIYVPFGYNSSWYFKVKDIYFTNSSEHLHRFLMLFDARKNNTDKPVIVDIGAANGSTAKFFSEHVKNSIVYAYEPNPRMWKDLDELRQSNDRIAIRKVALSDASGKSMFNRTANNLSSSILPLDNSVLSTMPQAHQNLISAADSFEVETRTLDEEMITPGRIACIKIDVQGFELKVLRGAHQTLERTDFVVIELNNHGIYREGCQYHEVDDFLRRKGFVLADIIVSYRTNNRVLEYDAIYEKGNHFQ